MTQIDIDQLEPTLGLRTSTSVTDPDQFQELLARIEEVDARGAKVVVEGARTTYSSQDEEIGSLISRTGVVVAYAWADGTRVLGLRNIELEYTDDEPSGWHPIGEPLLYLSTASDNKEQWQDGKRLFLRHSFETGAEELFAGWKDRFVALVPEEVGMKETKVFRSTRDGEIEVEHRYASPDGVMLYSRWVMDLADEFSDWDTADPSPKAGVYGLVAQQWLAREGANAQLSLTRELLKVVMSRLPSLARATETEFNISELARSLHTDRANLAKMSKTAKPTR